MWDYVTEDLPKVVFASFPVDEARPGMTGHSMGGHGALTVALQYPERFASVSAFAPIAHPTASDGGRKQFGAYLGADEAAWAGHDATLLMRESGFPGEVLVDQGAKDQFLQLLKPEALAEAMAARRQPGAFRMQAGYDHSYFFVASFMEEHIRFHGERL
jgi:S-formylglutathione hydrolase